MTLRGIPQGASPNAKYIVFWGYFRAFSAPFPFFLTLFPYFPLSHFSPPLPFPKEVNKKLSYREQNALSVIKSHERNAVNEHTGWPKLNWANAVSFIAVKHVLENFDNFW